VATKTIIVKCQFCNSEKVTKNGHNKTGKQVYNCNNTECKHRNFVESYTNNGSNPEIRRQVLTMAINGNGTRATGRILKISKDTVTAILKKTKTGFGR
jgi:transposase-like protein